MSRSGSASRRALVVRVTLVLALGAVVVGCASTPPAVPVTGSSQALSALAGSWEGEYSSEATGRSGSIRFTLRSETDSAFGDVVMVPAGSAGPLVRASDARAAEARAAGVPSSEMLTIRFVRAEGGMVSGSLDPYRAPDCDCVLTTTFTGELRGDTIEGTFVTTGDPTAARQTGRWRVTRR